MECVICKKNISDSDKFYRVPINWSPPLMIKDVESLCGTIYNINFMITKKQKETTHKNIEFSDEFFIYHDKIIACSIQHLFSFCDNTKEYEFSKSLPLFWKLYKDYI